MIPIQVAIELHDDSEATYGKPRLLSDSLTVRISQESNPRTTVCINMLSHLADRLWLKKWKVELPTNQPNVNPIAPDNAE